MQTIDLGKELFAPRRRRPTIWLPYAVVAMTVLTFIIAAQVVGRYGPSTTLVRWGGELYECRYDSVSLLTCAKQEYR